MKTGIFITALTFWFGLESAKAINMPAKTNTGQQVQEWVAQHVKYPETAKQNKEEGIVYVEFQVEHGKVSSSRVLEEANPCLNDAALKVVQQLPSYLLKSTEKATFILPIKFNLI